MLVLPTVGMQPHHVTAQFNSGELSFALSKEATLAELAEHFENLKPFDGAAPIAITVHFRAAWQQPAMLKQPTMLN